MHRTSRICSKIYQGILCRACWKLKWMSILAIPGMITKTMKLTTAGTVTALKRLPHPWEPSTWIFQETGKAILNQRSWKRTKPIFQISKIRCFPCMQKEWQQEIFQPISGMFTEWMHLTKWSHTWLTASFRLRKNGRIVRQRENMPLFSWMPYIFMFARITVQWKRLFMLPQV